MKRLSVAVCAMMFLAVGCQNGKMKMPWHRDKPSAEPMAHPMEKPSQPAEMKRLEAMVGNWDDTAEMSPATAEEMKKHQQEGKELQTTFKGEHKTEYIFDGKALRSEGWYEMPDNQRANFIEYIMWDPSQGRYRTWFMNDWCEAGAGWLTSDEAGRNFKGGAKSAHGKVSTTTTIVDNNNVKWSMSQKGEKGKFELSGTSKRK